MINGNAGEFIDRIYSCQDTLFIYQSIKYWFQGYALPNGMIHMEVSQYQTSKDQATWEYDGKTIEECHEAFLRAPIFDGKTFWDAEQDIEWVDD